MNCASTATTDRSGRATRRRDQAVHPRAHRHRRAQPRQVPAPHDGQLGARGARGAQPAVLRRLVDDRIDRVDGPRSSTCGSSTGGTASCATSRSRPPAAATRTRRSPSGGRWRRRCGAAGSTASSCPTPTSRSIDAAVRRRRAGRALLPRARAACRRAAPSTFLDAVRADGEDAYEAEGLELRRRLPHRAARRRRGHPAVGLSELGGVGRPSSRRGPPARELTGWAKAHGRPRRRRGTAPSSSTPSCRRCASVASRRCRTAAPWTRSGERRRDHHRRGRSPGCGRASAWPSRTRCRRTTRCRRPTRSGTSPRPTATTTRCGATPPTRRSTRVGRADRAAGARRRRHARRRRRGHRARRRHDGAAEGRSAARRARLLLGVGPRVVGAAAAAAPGGPPQRARRRARQAERVRRAGRPRVDRSGVPRGRRPAAVGAVPADDPHRARRRRGSARSTTTSSSASYTDDEIAAIEAQYAAERPRGAEPRWWEDVAEGDEVGPLVKGPLTVTDMICWHVGMGMGLYGVKALRLGGGQPPAHPPLLPPRRAQRPRRHAAGALGSRVRHAGRATRRRSTTAACARRGSSTSAPTGWATTPGSGSSTASSASSTTSATPSGCGAP